MILNKHPAFRINLLSILAVLLSAIAVFAAVRCILTPKETDAFNAQGEIITPFENYAVIDLSKLPQNKEPDIVFEAYRDGKTVYTESLSETGLPKAGKIFIWIYKTEENKLEVRYTAVTPDANYESGIKLPQDISGISENFSHSKWSVSFADEKEKDIIRKMQKDGEFFPVIMLFYNRAEKPFKDLTDLRNYTEAEKDSDLAFTVKMRI